MSVFRCYTEKRAEFDAHGPGLLHDLRDYLGIYGLTRVRVINRYDVEGITEEAYKEALTTVFSEPQTDDCYNETLPELSERGRLIIEALPGQYDQRADSCAQCIQMSTRGQRPVVRAAKLYAFYGDISDSDMAKLRDYLINPVESREAGEEKPSSLAPHYHEPAPPPVITGFISADEAELAAQLSGFGLAMDIDDLRFMRDYFRDSEKRDPTLTELRLIDTYWSDHCRHTTFNTHLEDIELSDAAVKRSFEAYLNLRHEVYGDKAQSRPKTLMDIATIAGKALTKRGFLQNIDVSEEINACSIHVCADVDGKPEDWLLMFKNETHNHPTEIEPFGGAATCIGGAIRDPLSGRAYVYQAMRVTGAGDPRVKVEDTIPGKLPQRKLTVTAARGYSSYGNQIGLSTGLVHELYHPGYMAKRMEIGAVVGAVKAENVVREVPAPGDKVILLGGRTGRDGIGGATGSSKTHTAQSLVEMASEVQKGNAPEERKIQRLFLDSEVTRMIKRCNDFGAGGVAVAIGELADGLSIDLSKVRKKYEGLDATELAISESQERMAVVVAPEDAEAFIKKAAGENLEAYVVAEITENPRMVMRFGDTVVADLSRDFLSSNGTVKKAGVRVTEMPEQDFDVKQTDEPPMSRLRKLVRELHICSQRGLYELFDGTVGAASVLMKNGGKTQSTPVQAMAALLPVPGGKTSTCSVMSFGFNPYLSEKNPHKGAIAAVVTSVAKLVASGCDPDTAYLTFQEYFERLRNEPARWGKPFSALLGALDAQMWLELAAIGGKDSMSGSFNDLDVPPTLVSFAIAPNSAECVISPEFKEAGHDVVIFAGGISDEQTVRETKDTWRKIRKLIADKTIVSAWAIDSGGAAEGIFKMALGNEIGFESADSTDAAALFEYTPGAIIAEVTRDVPGAVVIGRTIAEPVVKLCGESAELRELKSDWEGVLEDVFPTAAGGSAPVRKITCPERAPISAKSRIAKPRAVILAFPGTNSEIDTARAVNNAGGEARIVVVRNVTPSWLGESIDEAIRAIRESQMIIIPGGFSGGDEPDGAAKFITAFFRNPGITDAVHEHLKTRDGLILGICNGFQALIKLGLVPFGEIVPPLEGNPTLTYNLIGRHQSGYAYTRIASVRSPWMLLSRPGDIHTIAISHGEGRFVADDKTLSRLIADGQVATQYTDYAGETSMSTAANPNGSVMSVEGIFSPDGRVFGKMGHTERRGEFVAKNIYGDKHQPVFESGVKYYE